MVVENFENCVFYTLLIGTNQLPIQYFTIAEENFENRIFETHHITFNSPIQSFTLVEFLCENSVCETHYIGIKLPIMSFTIKKILKSVFAKRFILASMNLFSLSPWLKEILTIVF